MTELDLLKQKIRKIMNEIADDLALGAARDFGEYKHLTGQIAGLAMVERDILDMIERRSDDE